MYIMGSPTSHELVENGVQIVGICFKLLLEIIEIRKFPARSARGTLQMGSIKNCSVTLGLHPP